jgi:hypothetical protein
MLSALPRGGKLGIVPSQSPTPEQVPHHKSSRHGRQAQDHADAETVALAAEAQSENGRLDSDQFQHVPGETFENQHQCENAAVKVGQAKVNDQQRGQEECRE